MRSSCGDMHTIEWVHKGITCNCCASSAGGWGKVLVNHRKRPKAPKRTSSEWVMDTSLITSHDMLYSFISSKIDCVSGTCGGMSIRRQGKLPDVDITNLHQPPHWTCLAIN